MTQITQEQNIVGILYVGSHSYGLLQLNPVTHFGQPVYLSVGALVFNVVNSESQYYANLGKQNTGGGTASGSFGSQYDPSNPWGAGSYT